MWAYTVNEYKVPGARKTSIWRPLWDRCVYVLSIGKLLVSDSFLASITVSAQWCLPNFLPNSLPGDFITEIGGSLKFFFDYARGAPSTHSSSQKVDFAQAFGVGGRSPADGGKLPMTHSRSSYGEHIRLAPYPYSDARNADSSSPILSWSDGSGARVVIPCSFRFWTSLLSAT